MRKLFLVEILAALILPASAHAETTAALAYKIPGTLFDSVRTVTSTTPLPIQLVGGLDVLVGATGTDTGLVQRTATGSYVLGAGGSGSATLGALVSTPAPYSSLSSTTGLFSSTATSVGVAVSGAQVMSIVSSGASIAGTLSSSVAFPTANQTTTGQTQSVTVNANATGLWSALYLTGTGYYNEAKADSTTTMPVSALALQTGTGTKTVLFSGYARDDSWTWTPGGNIYSSSATAGAMTQTRPSTTGNQVQILGIARSATVIEFKPNLIQVEVP